MEDRMRGYCDYELLGQVLDGTAGGFFRPRGGPRHGGADFLGGVLCGRGAVMLFFEDGQRL